MTFSSSFGARPFYCTCDLFLRFQFWSPFAFAILATVCIAILFLFAACTCIFLIHPNTFANVGQKQNVFLSACCFAKSFQIQLTNVLGFYLKLKTKLCFRCLTRAILKNLPPLCFICLQYSC